jgi:hypothetical protein
MAAAACADLEVETYGLDPRSRVPHSAVVVYAVFVLRKLVWCNPWLRKLAHQEVTVMVAYLTGRDRPVVTGFGIGGFGLHFLLDINHVDVVLAEAVEILEDSIVRTGQHRVVHNLALNLGFLTRWTAPGTELPDSLFHN